MTLDQEHQVTLTTNECAALLAAAKTIQEAYSDDLDGEAYTVLASAAEKLAVGMKLSPEKAQQLADFMATGEMQ